MIISWRELPVLWGQYKVWLYSNMCIGCSLPLHPCPASHNESLISYHCVDIKFNPLDSYWPNDLSGQCSVTPASSYLFIFIPWRFYPIFYTPGMRWRLIALVSPRNPYNTFLITHITFMNIIKYLLSAQLSTNANDKKVMFSVQLDLQKAWGLFITVLSNFNMQYFH